MNTIVNMFSNEACCLSFKQRVVVITGLYSRTELHHTHFSDFTQPEIYTINFLQENVNFSEPDYPVSTGIFPHSLPEWAFRARPGFWRICLCPKVARIAEQKFGSR